MAPGAELLGSYPGGGIRSWGGASAAAPIVSGLLALMLAADPGLDPAAAIATLRSSSRDLDSSGFDAVTGFGRIDAAAALNASPNPAATDGPLEDLARWIALYRPSANTPDASLNQTGQQLVLPPALDSELMTDTSPNAQFSADSPWFIPLLLALFGFGLVVSLLLIIRGNGTRKTRKS